MPLFTPIPHDEFVEQVARPRRRAGQERLDAELHHRDRSRRARAGGVSQPRDRACRCCRSIIRRRSRISPTRRSIRLAARTRDGERLLFVDDINDTGATIGKLRAALATAGAARDHVRFATLLDNSQSKEQVEYRAEVIDRRTRKDWFVFPWEAVAPQTSLDADAAAVPERIA